MKSLYLVVIREDNLTYYLPCFQKNIKSEMGVPAFYRWLSEKYPKIVQDLLEQRDNVIDGTVVPINLNEPNPNGYAHKISTAFLCANE